MTTTVAFRVSDELVAEVDDLVASGRFANRTDAFRTALEGLVRARREALIDEAMVAGYLAEPQGDGDADVARAAMRAMLDEESW